MGYWTTATPAMMLRRQRLSVDRDRGPTQGQRLQEPDSPTRSAQPPAVFGARASEPRQEPDTRSYRACVRGAAERAGRSDRAHDWHGAGARQDRLAEPGLQHSPPGDAGTARRGMKVVESSAVFQPKQRTEKREAVTTANQSKTGPNPNLCPIRRQNRPLFEVPLRRNARTPSTFTSAVGCACAV